MSDWFSELLHHPMREIRNLTMAAEPTQIPEALPHLTGELLTIPTKAAMMPTKIKETKMLNLDKLQAAFPLLKQLLALSIPHAHTVAAVGAILDGIEAATAEDYTKNPLQAAAAGLAVIGAEVSQALAPASPVQAVPAPAPVSLS